MASGGRFLAGAGIARRGGVTGQPGPAPHLPAPTGPHPVGTTSLYLKDVSRPDPWAAGVSARELMVSLWYPAAAPDGPRTLTGLAEDLASHGYVAAGIDHTYESFATAFPDGRVTTCLARDAPRRGGAFWEKVVTGRAADVSFVLGELAGADPARPGAGLIDPSRMAMAGHSIGGASAIAALLADSRIRAGLDMDGATHARIPDHGLSRPFLFLGKQSNYTPGGEGSVTSWDRDWKLLTGWKRWLLVAGAVHASFTDLALLAGQAGLDTDVGVPGTRSLDITRAYVRAFCDQHLRGRPQLLLDQPSPRYPEVTFCHRLSP